MLVATFVPAIMFAGVNYLMDGFMRRKTWSENSKSEKFGVILSTIMAWPYVLCSLLGLLLGFDKYGAWTELIVNAGYTIPVVALVCGLASLILRKVGKSKIANATLIAGLVYMVAIIGAAFVLG